MLVVVALAMATMLAVPFLMTQGTSAAVGRNITDHARAKAIAESGIELALAYVYQNAGWHNEQTPGVWFDELTFGDGVVRLTAQNADEEAPTETLASIVILASEGRVNGVSHTARARLDRTAPSTPGFNLPYGLALTQQLELAGQVSINAMDSRVDTYNPHMDAGHAGTHDATIATNATGAGQVALTGDATIHGNVLVGPGDEVDPEAVVAITGDGTARVGEKGQLTEAMALPDVTRPANLPPSAGDYVLASSVGTEETLTGGTYRYDNFVVGGNSTLYIEGDVTIVADGTFAADNNGRIRLREGASLTVYTDRLHFTGDASLKHVDHYDPTAATLVQTGSDTVRMRGSAEIAAGIIAPHARLDMYGQPRLFGAFYGQSAQIHGNARLTQDTALFDADAGGGSGGSHAGSYQVRWLALD